MQNKWFKTNDSLPDGWYFWRASEKDKDPQVVQICGGFICDLCNGGKDGYDIIYYEHQDYSGEWFGPLEVPK